MRKWTLLIGPAGIGVLPGERPGYEGIERVVVVPADEALAGRVSYVLMQVDRDDLVAARSALSNQEKP